jgi:hypothetical protein
MWFCHGGGLFGASSPSGKSSETIIAQEDMIDLIVNPHLYRKVGGAGKVS